MYCFCKYLLSVRNQAFVVVVVVVQPCCCLRTERSTIDFVWQLRNSIAQSLRSIWIAL